MFADVIRFTRFLGNPLDGSVNTNIMYFSGGKCRSMTMSSPDDVARVERFVQRADGKHQLYMNVNPAVRTASGKPKDVDIPTVKNLYLDIDAVKPDSTRKNPTTLAEIEDIPLGDILCAVGLKYTEFCYDFTGNGYRVLIPVKDAHPVDEVNFVWYMHKLFPDYIDKCVVDPSRVTGVPGTMNVKIETGDRKNRRREPFDPVLVRREQVIATYTDDELLQKPTPPPSVRSPIGNQRTPVTPDKDSQQLLNSYIVGLSLRAPHILKVLTSAPDNDNGLSWDSLFATEVYNKIGDAPRVFALMCKAHWGSDYSSTDTQAVWERTVSAGVRPWSNATITRLFGV